MSIRERASRLQSAEFIRSGSLAFSSILVAFARLADSACHWTTSPAASGLGSEKEVKSRKMLVETLQADVQ